MVVVCLFKTKLIEGNKKSGIIYKRGDGPINFAWNQRYFVVDGNSVSYYQNASDKTPRWSGKILGAKVSEVTKTEVYITFKRAEPG